MILSLTIIVFIAGVVVIVSRGGIIGTIVSIVVANMGVTGSITFRNITRCCQGVDESVGCQWT